MSALTPAQGKGRAGLLVRDLPPVRLPALAAVPVLYVLTNLVFRYSVSLLNFAFQLILPTLDRIQIIIREFAPLFFDLSLDLLPVSFNTIPVHGFAPHWVTDRSTHELPPQFDSRGGRAHEDAAT
jgi:hypothetical protein